MCLVAILRLGLFSLCLGRLWRVVRVFGGFCLSLGLGGCLQLLAVVGCFDFSRGCGCWGCFAVRVWWRYFDLLVCLRVSGLSLRGFLCGWWFVLWCV